jgi:hypothetical protein
MISIGPGIIVMGPWNDSMGTRYYFLGKVSVGHRVPLYFIQILIASAHFS